MGRSQKALKNISTGFLNKAILMLLSFTTKTTFIRLLGAEYNGVSSLFSNILSVLALAELGMGNVLMFYLYVPLRENDQEKICSLVQQFKKIYRIIIVFVLSVGLLLIPFIPMIIKSDLPLNELIVYYILYLVNSVVSYFVVFRTMVISADQKGYILNNVCTLTTVIMYILQLIYLFTFRNFLGYLIIQILCTLGNNLLQNHIVLKQYPFMKKKVKNATDGSMQKRIFSDVKATFLFKVSDTILDQTDNIIISAMFGTIFVGYYANYYMIMAYLAQIASIIVSGLTAGFGNLYAEGDKEKSFEMFRCSMFLFSIYGTFTTACYASIIQQFIPMWVGNQYVMGFDLVVAILIVYYIRMVTNTVWIYRSTMGIFKEVQYINLLAAVLNIILSVILGKLFGVPGIIVATGISRLLTSFWYEGKVVFNKLDKDPVIYYKTQIKDLFITAVIVFTSLFINHFIAFEGLMGMLLKMIVCIFCTTIIEIIINRNTKEMNMIISKLHAVVVK